MDKTRTEIMAELRLVAGMHKLITDQLNDLRNRQIILRKRQTELIEILVRMPIPESDKEVTELI